MERKRASEKGKNLNEKMNASAAFASDQTLFMLYRCAIIFLLSPLLHSLFHLPVAINKKIRCRDTRL